MSDNVKGITVEINGETKNLNTALKKVNSEAKGLQTELKGVDTLLKLDPKNVDLLKQKQELLNSSISDTNKKISALKTAKNNADADMANGTQVNQEQYRKLVREMSLTETKLENLMEASKDFGSVATQQIATVSKKVGEVGDNLVTAGKKASLLSAGIVAGGAVALNSASDMSESINKVEVAFGSADQEVKRFAKTTLDTYGIAEGTALDMSALFGDMGTSMSLPQKNAAEMSVSLTGLAGDLSSFKNISLDESMTALKGVFTGETESLKNIGVVMTQTNLDAYALANGFGQTTQQMTEAEKVQLRYEYVMNATKNAQGDFARTSDGTANSLRVMKESTKELSASFGEVLIPIITPLIQEVTKFVKWIGTLNEDTKKIIVTVLVVVAAIGPLLIMLGQMAIGVSGIIKILPLLKTGITAVNAAMKANPIGIVIALIAALIAYYVNLYQTNEEFRKKVDAAWAAIKATFIGTIGAITDKLNEFVSIGKNVVKGIWDGINNSKDWLLGKIKKWCGSILKGVKAFFGIKSPSTVFRDEVGKNIVLGIDKGIQEEGPKAIKSMKELSQHILSEATKWVDDKKFYNKLTLQDELEFWEDLKSMEGLQADELSEIDRKIFTSKQVILDEEKKVMDEYVSSVQSRTDALKGFAGIFDSVSNDAKISGQELLKNLQSQVSEFKNWQEDIENLKSRGIGGALLEELQQMGPSISKEIDALAGLNDEDLKKYGELYAEKTMLATEQAMKELGGIVVPIAGVSNAISDMQANASYAVTSTADTTNIQKAQEEMYSMIANMLAQAVLEGLNYVGNSIFDAIPKKADFNINGGKIAEATWSDYTVVGGKRSRIFAPSREEIANIAMSVMPKPIKI